jgi:HrpA-like RNA helicase
LTPLGTLLAQLPVDPRIGKMMLFGAGEHHANFGNALLGFERRVGCNAGC